MRMRWDGSFKCYMAGGINGLWKCGDTPKQAHDAWLESLA